MVFVLSTAWDKEKILSAHEELNLRPSESEGLRFNSSWGLRIFLCSVLLKKPNFIFLYFFTELKTYHLSNFNVICDTSSKNILNIHSTVKVREMAVETVQLLL